MKIYTEFKCLKLIYTYLSFIMRVFFLPIFSMIIYKVQTELPSLSKIPGRKQSRYLKIGLFGSIPHTLSGTPNTDFTNIPCLNKTTFSNNCSIYWEVYSCKENIRDFLFPAVIAICEMSWKWHIQFIIWYMAKSTACRQIFF